MAHVDDRIRAAGKFFRRGGEKWLLKGVSYGPFEGADSLPRPERAESDLRQIAALGFNTLRLYASPPEWFLEVCAAHQLNVLIGLQWPAHTDFLRDRRSARGIIRQARETVRGFRGSRTVLGFFVGNEVPATMLRWLGVARVRRFIERLIAMCRREFPEAIFAYATYPSTEFLNPRNADFIAYNVYLERREDFEHYLVRLQNIAGDQPLVISEFGLDTRTHGEAQQAATLLWAWESALRAGLAGQIVFSFTDEWFTAGREMSEWGFGVVTRGRREKEACPVLGGWLPGLSRPGQGVRLRRTPRISVIVCTFNGSPTLRRALESLERLVHPDHEVIVVDDGSSDAVPEIAAEFREVRYLRIEHAGLSAARNAGARAATGEILAFLDDDAAADDDWLAYLSLAFERERVGAAGGPNIPPENAGFVAACVAAAPGGPAHVLMNDSDAEHVPGCNLAVRREAWEEVGGFDERYRTAGDDVDFCWRLMDHGYRIAFHAGAMVWHDRRSKVAAFLRQQIGYGQAEALLIKQHRHRFGKLGGARWRGSIYEPVWQRVSGLAGVIYHGVFGYAPYQVLYAPPHSAANEIMTSVHWLIAAAIAGAVGFRVPWMSAVAVVMVLVPVGIAARTAWRSPLPFPHDHAGGKVLVFWLALAQPVVRGLARLAGCVRHASFPSGPWLTGPLWRRPLWRRRKNVAELALWSEHGRDRDVLLKTVLDELSAAGWAAAVGDAWAPWDIEVRRGRWWDIRCTTVTEFHGGANRLTRVRLSTRATRRTLVLATVLVAGVLPLAASTGVLGIWILAMSFLAWLGLEFHHGAVAAQALRLILHTARKNGFRLLNDPPPVPANETRMAESATGEQAPELP